VVFADVSSFTLFRHWSVVGWQRTLTMNSAIHCDDVARANKQAGGAAGSGPSGQDALRGSLLAEVVSVLDTTLGDGRAWLIRDTTIQDVPLNHELAVRWSFLCDGVCVLRLCARGCYRIPRVFLG
jgi:hypothetical protein